MRITTRRTAALVCVAIASVLAGCMGEDEGTKAGGTGGALTLRIGAPDERGRPAADQIEEFARRVEALSDGELRIEPVWRVAGGRPFWDQRSARKVTSGELDMAVIPSRAWDTQGSRACERSTRHS